MKKTCFYIKLMVVVFIVFSLGCWGDKEIQVADEKDIKEVNKIMEPIIEFDSDLYSDAYKYEKTESARKLFSLMVKRDENFVFSPLSLEAAMHLLSMTAAGKSKEAVDQFLNLDKKTALESLTYIQQTFELLKKRSEYLTKDAETAEIDFSSGIVSSKRLKLDEKKVKEINKHLDVFWEEYDFSTEGEVAKDEINEWVEKKTRDKIKNLIGELPLDTLMVLLNALYLKISWAEAFKESQTKDVQFNVSKEKSVLVKALHRTHKTEYVKNKIFQAVNIELSNSDLSFWVMLPTGNIDSLVKLISESSLKTLFENSEFKKVSMALPKIKIENKLRLVKNLRKMGLSIITESPNYELSELYSKKEDIIVGEVVQGNFFTFDEGGIEAASATAIMMGAGGAPQPEEILELKFDRPFLFMLYQKMTGRLLFMGQVANPNL